MFSWELRDAAARGEITVSIRLWSCPQVNQGRWLLPNRRRILEIGSLEFLPFSAVTDDDVRAALCDGMAAPVVRDSRCSLSRFLE